MAQETVDWTCALEIAALVGEEPIWNAEEGALYWIDLFGPSLNRTKFPGGDTRSWKMPELIGTYALLGDGRGAIVALETGLFHLTFADGALRLLSAAPYDVGNYRFNDGRCDRAGRFWVGTNRLPTSKHPIGGAAWYCYDGRELTYKFGDTTIANGIAWSPDNRTMYIVDKPNWQIIAFDYDIATATATNRRRFASLPEGHIPDGANVDDAGGYWLALINTGRVVRYRPEGSIDRDLKAPTNDPTMPAFGGPGLDVMYLTTLSDRRFASPYGERRAGSIFSAKVGARGLPEPKFTLPGT